MTLSPEIYVKTLYNCLLGREPDPNGQANAINLIERTGDYTAILFIIIESQEYKRKLIRGSSDVEDITQIIKIALKKLDRNIIIIDIGAQLLGVGSNPYDGLLQHCSTEITGFDPLEDRLLQRAAVEMRNDITLMPYAIGDGESHTFYINNDDATSSLFPLNVEHNACFNHLESLTTVRSVTIRTRKLDDLISKSPVDYLKLDIQGAELMALKGAERTLAGTAVVHCEVEFAPIYLGQPLYPDVQRFLNERGFELIDLLPSGRYHYLTKHADATDDRLLWGDAVFFRVTEDPDTLVAQAVIAAAIYAKVTLARHLLAKAQKSYLKGL